METVVSACALAGVIVEIGGNHEGDIEYAFRLVDSAIEAGATSIKIQSYVSDSFVNKRLDPSRAEHFKKFTLPHPQQIKIAEYILSRGCKFMSSLWDKESFKILDPYINIHKVGSGDLTNFPMIKTLCETKKPLILSTAMANKELIFETVDFIFANFPHYRDSGQLALLQCVAMYGDLNDSYANLNAITDLKSSFPDITIGYSDHTRGVEAAIMSLSLGAEIIEVHFTDDKSRAFRDHHLSIDASELKLLLSAFDRAHKILGNKTKNVVKAIETQERIREFRRGCYLLNSLEAGEKVCEENLITLRPCHGIPSSEFYKIIGKRTKQLITALEPLDWSMFG